MENLLDSKKEIFANLDTIYANIEKAAAVSDRKKEDIQLMAVTKTVEPERVNMAIE